MKLFYCLSLSLIALLFSAAICQNEEAQVEANTPEDNKSEEIKAEADAEDSEDNQIDEVMIELGLDKKDNINREEFKLFLEKILMREVSNEKNPEEEEFVNFLISKAVAMVPEEFTKDELKEFMNSDKMKKAMEEALQEKFGMNLDDMMGAFSGSMGEGTEGGSEEIPKLDDLEGLKDMINAGKEEIENLDTKDKDL